MIKLVAILMLALYCASAHAQVVTCASTVATNAQYAACATPSTITAAPVSGSAKILWCSSVVTGGAARTACSTAIWQTWGYMASWSWVLTSYAGWQRFSDVTFSATPPPPPPPPPNPPTNPAANGTTISWGAVTTNTDGSPVTSVTYRIEYGQTDFAQFATTAATSYAFSGLAVGTWQFRVIAISAGGQSIATSAVFFVVIPASQQWLTSATQVYEAVLPLTGSILVRGNPEGSIALGKPCGAQVFLLAGVSYRAITQSDAALGSPTYLDRQHVAACSLQ